MAKHSEHDVVALVLTLASQDGCIRETGYCVDNEIPRKLPGAAWHPMLPRRPLINATLATHYRSGRVLTVEMEGEEFQALEEQSRFEKLLASICGGRAPGEALKRQLTKAFDLPPLPKLRKARPH